MHSLHHSHKPHQCIEHLFSELLLCFCLLLPIRCCASEYSAVYEGGGLLLTFPATLIVGEAIINYYSRQFTQKMTETGCYYEIGGEMHRDALYNKFSQGVKDKYLTLTVSCEQITDGRRSTEEYSRGSSSIAVESADL